MGKLKDYLKTLLNRGYETGGGAKTYPVTRPLTVVPLRSDVEDDHKITLVKADPPVDEQKGSE